jgi:hypothetical protein
MTPSEQPNDSAAIRILTPEQDALLDLYLKKLDDYLTEVKDSEKRQVEIETLHLKKILTK